MPKLDFRKLEPCGKCSHCGINCWSETDGNPAIWPCSVSGCPYPAGNVVAFPRSATGTSLSQIIYSGS
jgi:hypothetical protein